MIDLALDTFDCLKPKSGKWYYEYQFLLRLERERELLELLTLKKLSILPESE